MEIVVRADPQAVAREAAGRVVAASRQAIGNRGAFAIALAGGSTPALLYELLASSEHVDRLDWSHTDVFFGDERCVPPDHEWSNFAMAQRTLFRRVPIPPERLHRIAGERPPDEAAAAYAATVRTVLPPAPGRVPRFDLVLLGMGDDGHTASLFPGMPVLSEDAAWVVATDVPEYVRPHVPRVSLTLPVLNAAREVLFLVTGQAKAAPVRRVLVDSQRDAAAARLPAARVRPQAGVLTWLLDEAAASAVQGEHHG